MKQPYSHWPYVDTDMAMDVKGMVIIDQQAHPK